MSVVLTSNAVYQPFTFEELLKPLAMYTEEYRNVEDNIAELESKSELIKRYAMEDPNSEAARMYTEYAQNLDKQVEALAKYGLPSVNRRSLYNLKSQYSSNITPIEIAIARRAEDAKSQQEAMMKDPTLFLSRDASMTSLDDYIRNPNLSYSSYSGDTLAKQVAAQTQGFANKLRNVAVSGTSDPYVNAFLENYGYTMEDVRQAMQNPQGVAGMGILNDIVNNVVAQSGIHTWDNWDEIKGEVYRHAGRGLVAGIGKDNLSFREDYGAKRAAMRADEIWKRGLDSEESIPQNTTYSGASEGIKTETKGVDVGKVSWNPNTGMYESSKLRDIRERNTEYVTKNKPTYTYDPRFGINRFDQKLETYNAEEQRLTQELDKIKNNNTIALSVLGNSGGKLFEFETKKHNSRLGRQEILDPEIKKNKAFIDRTKKDIYSSILSSSNHFFDPNTGDPVTPNVDTKKSADNIHLKIFADPKTNKILTEINGQVVEYKGIENIESANIEIQNYLRDLDFSDKTLLGATNIPLTRSEFMTLSPIEQDNIIKVAADNSTNNEINIVLTDDVIKILDNGQVTILSELVSDPKAYNTRLKSVQINALNSLTK